MSHKGFTASFSVAATPREVFAAIQDVRRWWSGEIDGDSDKLGSEFTYRYKDIHVSKQTVTELVVGKRLVWRVSESNLSFAGKKNEWDDTDIVFEVSAQNGETTVRFTHLGLLPQNECYESCSNGWDMLINGNLRRLISNGGSQPDVFAS